METRRSEGPAPARPHERKRSARSELEWIAAREEAARDEIRHAVVGLGQDLGRALHVPARNRDHPLVRIALERAGEALGSDLVLEKIETGALRMGARAMARSGAMAAASTWIQDLLESVGHSKTTRDAGSSSTAIGARDDH